jgi:phosphoadenosine phosphosulfate reductase
VIDTAIQFSGGKDSLACLYLYRERWDTTYVVWLDTGAAYPEMVEYMEKWKQRLPHFIHVKSDQPSNVRERGWPVDVLPVENTLVGRMITGNDGPLMQSYLDCCAVNIWVPLYNACKKLGIRYLVKGQRGDDRRKSLAVDGQVVDGIQYVMPIQGWTEEQVFKYLKDVEADMPPGYGMGEKTGRDCWNCTAYLDDNRKRIYNLPEDKRAEMLRRLAIIDGSIEKQWIRV